MKQKILFISLILLTILIGCSLNNTPTSKVEELLSKYQMLDSSIDIYYTDLFETDDITDDYQERIIKLIQKQYKNLVYEIKDEEIDGDNAVVTVQIEVLDYNSVYSSYNNPLFDYEAVIGALEDTKDKITYTIEFNCYKDADNTWHVSDLTSEIETKLLGMY